ncbi:Tricarboxylate transport protein [Venustampulla echinocandica]|uniref:Tricarboxylate transport protein n=1 Tax=Venustampulla echinocandica TaxID=2656787 RepID=A0A370TAN1_9HELO|nr:Tricarboxylate transport protein [Venustampulla echinocandica]RDL30995.1 Tricarboxylate transport protein [Venustampulla echinocandica]
MAVRQDSSTTAAPAEINQKKVPGYVVHPAFGTYPFEFAKTSVQLQGNDGSRNPIKVILNVTRSHGILAVYSGCGSLVIGCVGKAAVRFLTFDTTKAQLRNSSGELSFGRGILTGMAAGVAESLLAVTPTERIKTAIIDDAKHARRFRSSLHAVQVLLRERGVADMYRGCLATTMKQSATSAVRMGTYNILKQWSQTAGVASNAVTTFAMGGAAGVVTVYATQPFDTIKTRSQGIAGASIGEALKGVIQDSGGL